MKHDAAICIFFTISPIYFFFLFLRCAEIVTKLIVDHVETLLSLLIGVSFSLFDVLFTIINKIERKSF